MLTNICRPNEDCRKTPFWFQDCHLKNKVCFRNILLNIEVIDNIYRHIFNQNKLIQNWLRMSTDMF
jgi:hypothetical protein